MHPNTSTLQAQSLLQGGQSLVQLTLGDTTPPAGRGHIADIVFSVLPNSELVNGKAACELRERP